MMIPILNQLEELAKKGNKVRIRQQTFTFRCSVFGLPLDTVEIPNVLGTKGHGSPDHCPCCMFEGVKTKGEKRMKTHYCRWSTRSSPYIDIFDSQRYKAMLNDLENNKKTKLKRSSIVVLDLASFFPTQIVTVDMLHTIALGLFKQWLALLEFHFPDIFDQMTFMSQYMKLPRMPSEYIFDINKKVNWKSRDYFLFGTVTGPVLLGIIKFSKKHESIENEVKECFFQLSSIMRELNDKREEVKLTTTRVLELEKEFAEYEKKFAALFKHLTFKPNNHRVSHLFRHVILFGRPFVFSMYSFEDMNMLAPQGVKGTKNPLDSFLRYYQNLLTISKAKAALLESHYFRDNFPRTFAKMFPDNVQRMDKSPSKLSKVLSTDSSEVFFYLESSEQEEKDQKHANWYIEYKRGPVRFIGKIQEMFSNDKLELNVVRLKKVPLAVHFEDRFFSVQETENLDSVYSDSVVQIFGHLRINKKIILFSVIH